VMRRHLRGFKRPRQPRRDVFQGQIQPSGAHFGQAADQETLDIMLMMTVRMEVSVRLARPGEEVGVAATGRTWLRARRLTKVIARMQLFQRDVPRNAGGFDANPQ
jgi:hypothetical protein